MVVEDDNPQTQTNYKSEHYFTLWSNKDGQNEQIGRLEDPAVPEEGKRDGPAKPYVFISQTQRDGTRTLLSKPTQWFLTNILNVDVFLDEIDGRPGRILTETLSTAAFECSHALLILSPSFRSRKYCVLELNTFMHRLKSESPVTLQVIPILWGINDCEGYSSVLNDIIWSKARSLDHVQYLTQTLWPHLLDAFGRRPMENETLLGLYQTYVDTSTQAQNDDVGVDADVSASKISPSRATTTKTCGNNITRLRVGICAILVCVIAAVVAAIVVTEQGEGSAGRPTDVPADAEVAPVIPEQVQMPPGTPPNDMQPIAPTGIAPTPMPVRAPVPIPPGLSEREAGIFAYINAISYSSPIAYQKNATFSAGENVESQALAWLIESDPAQIPASHLLRLRQRFVLAAWRLQWADPSDVDNWMSEENECSWSGLNCSQSAVSRIRLFDVQGTIPSDLGILTALTSLFVRLIQPGGTIPTTLGSLKVIEELYLNVNDLVGTIPTEFGQLTELSTLALAKNHLSGTIPTELVSLTKLDYAFLFDTLLTGQNPLCGTGRSIYLMIADCDEVWCECCDFCCPGEGYDGIPGYGESCNDANY